MNNAITNLQYLSLTEATSDVSLKNNRGFYLELLAAAELTEKQYINILGYIDQNYADCLPENKSNRHMFIDGDSDL
tara:strand:+ start:1583 stop:1810 length:228 start_codon:yes stop_codon:yes gene_type:complete